MNTLDDATRLAYLKEMGITVWQSRTAAINAVESIPTGDTSTSPITPKAVESQGDKKQTWIQLLDEIMHCQKCHLAKTRNKIVPGVGDTNADWLFVGEGPGFYEDQQGEPFVGKSGQLLDNMLLSLNLVRGRNVYIANIVKCRASEAGKDRQPTEEESAICMPFLEKQIALIAPKIIVALGKTAACALLRISREPSLSSLRKKVHTYEQGGMTVPLVITYHPSYLLRTPQGKAQAWEDLCLAMDTLEGIQNTN